MRLFPLAAAFVIVASPAAAQIGTSSPTMLAEGTLLEVSATGTTTRVPDIATIRAGVVTQSAAAAGALQENAQRMARVLSALKGAGVAARDIQTATIALQPQYRYADNQPPVITGYQASNAVTIRFRDVAASGRILDALVREGANQIDGPTLSIDKPDAALDEARADAVTKARARADLYAKAAGLRVGRILSISENGDSAPLPPRPMAVARAASMADTRVEAGEQDIAVTLTVRFLLN